MTDATRDGQEIAVADDRAESAFTATVDGEIVGRAVYRLKADPQGDVKADVVVFTHTEVMPSMQGQGIANVLAHRALEEVAASGRTLVPQCPFIAAYIRSHPEYAELVEPAHR